MVAIAIRFIHRLTGDGKAIFRRNDFANEWEDSDTIFWTRADWLGEKLAVFYHNRRAGFSEAVRFASLCMLDRLFPNPH